MTKYTAEEVNSIISHARKEKCAVHVSGESISVTPQIEYPDAPDPLSFLEPLVRGMEAGLEAIKTRRSSESFDREVSESEE